MGCIIKPHDHVMLLSMGLMRGLRPALPAANNLKPLSTRGGDFPSFYWKKSPAGTSPSNKANDKSSPNEWEPRLKSPPVMSPVEKKEKDNAGEGEGEGEDAVWRTQVLGEYLSWCAQKAQEKAKEAQVEEKPGAGAEAKQGQAQAPQGQKLRRGSSKPRWEALYEDSKERAAERLRLRQEERGQKRQAAPVGGRRRPSAGGGRKNSAS